MRITVVAKTHAKTNKLEVVDDGTVRAFVVAAPIDNKANDAITKLLADHFKCAPTSIRLIRGHTSKTKIFDLP